MRLGLCLLVCLVMAGCDGTDDDQPATGVRFGPPSALAEKYTIGNHSWVPIIFSHSIPTSLIPHVLGQIRAFEVGHPYLVVTSFSVEKSQDSTNSPDYGKVVGIWLTHLPKEQCFPNYKPPAKPEVPARDMYPN